MRRWFAWLTLGLAACQFDGQLPADASFACAADADCPTGLVCHRTTGLCVSPLGLGEVAISAALLEYQPAASNLVRQVSAARADTRVQLDLTFNQPVSCGTLTAAPAGLIAFALLTSQGTACRFSGVPLVAAAGDWPCTLEVTVTDSLGQTSTLPVSPSPAPLRIDTQPPAPPQVDPDDSVVYLRAPWGAQASPAGNQVTGAAASVEASTLVRVLASASGPALELQRGTATATGAFGPVTIPGDPERVAVSALDEAGNESPAAPVRDVVWTATHDQREASASTGNPHRVLVRQANTSGEVQSSETEVSGDAGIGRVDGARLEVSGGPGWWQPRGQELPLNSTGASFAAVFDTHRARVIAVGGYPVATFAWEGTNWVKVATGPALSGTSSFTAAYDARRDRVVVYAGLEGTWEFDNRSTWGRVVTDEVPSVRHFPYLSYDPTLGEVVLAGGGDYSGYFFPQPFFANELSWSYDGQRWRRLSPTPALSGREYERGTYDPVHRTHVLFGGSTSQTRLWSATQSSVVATTGPSPRREHCMVWDARQRKVLLLGGESPDGLVTYDDVWAWDGTSWSQLSGNDGGTVPVAARAAACAYDAARDEVVLGGGVGRSDTRAFRAGRLEQRVGPSSPNPTGLTIGADDGVVAALSDGGTFRWSNGGWSWLPDAGGPRHSQLTWDPGSRRVLGLESGGTALWGFETGQWTQLAPTPTVEPYAAWLFFDIDAGHAVFETPSYAAAYRGGAWVTVRDAGSPGIAGAQPVYSPAHDAVARIVQVQTQLWNGSGWDQLDGGRLLPQTTAAMGRQLVSDPVGRRVFMTAGATLATLDGNGWSAVNTLNVGPLFTFCSAAYDVPNRRLWVHEQVVSDRIWELSLSELRPAIVSHFVLPELGSSTVKSLTLSAVAGGSGGARARLWYRSRWQDPSSTGTASNASPAAQPSALSLSLTEPGQLAELLGGAREVSTVLEPVLDNGASAATVAADYVELTVRYRVP